MLFWLILGLLVVIALVAGAIYDRRYPGAKPALRGRRGTFKDRLVRAELADERRRERQHPGQP